MNYSKPEKLHIVTVVAVIRNDEGRYLILKRHDNEKVYPGMFTFPGGKMEDNETIEETLSKETLEETGLKLKEGKILLKDKSILRPDSQTAKSLSFLCEVEGSDKVKISGEFTDYRWVNVKELRELKHVGIEEELEKADSLYGLGINLAKIQTKSVKVDLSKK